MEREKYEKIYEISSWLLILIIIFTIRFFPTKLIESEDFYYVIGGFLSFLILYYYLIWKHFPREKRLYVKDVAEVIIIGILIIFAKNLGIYFFSLFLLPIVAAALTLNVARSILIVILACSFVAFETLLFHEGELPQFYLGFWQLLVLIIITIFCRFLALEVRHRREAEEEARIRALQLEEAERLRKEFVALTAHQLFTPLSIIRGFVSLLVSEDLGKLTDKQKGPVSQIYENVKKMIRLVSELLTASRIERDKPPLKLEERQLEGIIAKITGLMKTEADNKKLYLRFERPKKLLPLIKVDADKIEHVLYNLIDNGIRYTKKGGVVIKMEQKKDEIIISVKDTGLGIPSDYMDRLFQPFFRGENILELEKKGTGLGLFIAKSLIDKHQGRIWAESKEGKGSTFYFSLPIK